MEFTKIEQTVLEEVLSRECEKSSEFSELQLVLTGGGWAEASFI